MDLRSNLLIKKSDIEKALGVSIEPNNKKPKLNDDLSTFAMFPELSIEDVICVFLDIPFSDRPIEFNRIYAALVDAIENKRIKGRIDYDCHGYASYFISHDTANQWAKTYGLNWNVPSYKDPNATIVENTSEENDNLEKELEQAKQRIVELETILQSKEEQAEKVNFNAVDYDQFSIYGHTSENLNIVFEVIKKFASKVDKDNPHSYPTKEELKAFIKRYFSDNEKLAEAIYQIIIPENVKTRGRTPQGVETFQGFN
ncbi:hypothetical protein [Gallibacterium anatis]|uniref:hypothetical protein n=1 Tax=Gallibacterium anatis TaxID=750 RepID=UPI000BA069CB|nr:hypothetical protein [Gallibacterium anatis]OZN49605.1 hypothetical protein CF595_03905 [Gallibacterium anatis]